MTLHPNPYRTVRVSEPDPARIPEDTVSRAQRGDPQAFERLYRDNAGRVYTLCLRMVANPSRAGELTQDVFVRAWQMLPTFRGESAFSTWLHRLAVNVVLVDIRSATRREARVTTVEDLSALDPGTSAGGAGNAMDLENGIASLPTQARAILILHDIEGFRHEEIAEQLGIAVGTSKAQLHRARRILREVLNS